MMSPNRRSQVGKATKILLAEFQVSKRCRVQKCQVEFPSSFTEDQEVSQLPSLTYENLAASSGRLASLLSATGSSDGSSSNEYYEEVAFRNGVASKGAARHNEPPDADATEDQDDDQVRSSL